MSNSIYRNATDVVMSASTSFDVSCHDGATKGLKLGGILVASTQAEIDRNCKVNQRIVNLTLATLVMSQAAHDSRVLTINKADGTAITLPAATGSGTRFTICVGTKITSNTITITTGSGDYFGGLMSAEGTSNACKIFVADGSTSHIITLNGGTQGGYIGDRIELIDVANHLWNVQGRVQTSGSQATCFS
jgi:hypothetical protein